MLYTMSWYIAVWYYTLPLQFIFFLPSSTYVCWTDLIFSGRWLPSWFLTDVLAVSLWHFWDIKGVRIRFYITQLEGKRAEVALLISTYISTDKTQHSSAVSNLTSITLIFILPFYHSLFSNTNGSCKSILYGIIIQSTKNTKQVHRKRQLLCSFGVPSKFKYENCIA